jgi:LPS export ABC transporter protein LptC
MTWQRRLRFGIALVATAFAVVVVLALQRRAPQPPAPPVVPETGAVVEVTGGQVERFSLSRQDVRVAYGRQLTFADGSTRLMDVTIASDDRAGGKSFSVTGREADVGSNESTIRLTGDVRLTAPDSTAVTAEQASYSDKDGLVRSGGPVEFARGRLKGSGVGMTYDTARDVLIILDRTTVHVAADETGAGGADVTSGSVTFARAEQILRFDRDVRIRRGGRTMQADTAVARLTADEMQIETMELRGNSRIAVDEAVAGSVEELSGDAADLHYGSDGEVLEGARLTGQGAIRLAGPADAPGRQIRAESIDVAMAPDGATPVSLDARGSVVLVLPGEGSQPTRTIDADAMDAKGEPPAGLRSARFTGDVEFRERPPEREDDGGDDRVARSQVLDVTLEPAMAGLRDATFSRQVEFVDQGMTADAATARYDLAKGLLALSGSEPGAPRPHVVNDRLTVDAARIDVVLAGPDLRAMGDVRSVLRPDTKSSPAPAARPGAERRARPAQSVQRVPSMFRQDAPVNVIAETLVYDAASRQATYAGDAQLWQDETSVKGATIVLNEQTGNLTATGGVTTVTVREDPSGSRGRTIATAADFAYDESGRRATYTGKAHMNSPDGDLTAARIELYFPDAEGAAVDELERAEAYEDVTLRDRNRTATGGRLTYTTADQRYVVTGTPVRVLDECRRETVGRRLTYIRSSETLIIDGSEQIRAQTTGSGQCP